MLLDELRLVSSAQAIETRIDFCGRAPDTKSLTREVLLRLEQECDPSREGGIRLALSFLAQSRAGLPEQDLRDALVSTLGSLPLRLDAALLWIEGSFMAKGGLVAFSSAPVKEAVVAFCLHQEVVWATARGRLIGYLWQRNGPAAGSRTDFGTCELAWQLAQEMDLEALCCFLGDVDVVRRLWSRCRHELATWWRLALEFSGEELRQRIMVSIAACDLAPSVLTPLLSFFTYAEEWDLALACEKRVLSALSHQDIAGLTSVKLARANMLMARGHASAAEAAYKQLVAALGEDSSERRAALVNLGGVFSLTARFESARRAYEEAQCLATRAGDQALLAVAALGLGDLAFAEGATQRATRAYQQCERVAAGIDDLSTLRAGLRNHAIMLASLGKIRQAIVKLERESVIASHINPAEKVRNLILQAQLRQALRNDDDALSNLREAESDASRVPESGELLKEVWRGYHLFYRNAGSTLVAKTYLDKINDSQ
jgi:tetratricopeptide (TPR) repeat protein